MSALFYKTPPDEHHTHPGYRYLTIQVRNTWSPQADQYGISMAVQVKNFDTGVTLGFGLISRKVVDQVSGDNIYEFDIRSLLQDILSYMLPTYGGTKDSFDSSAMLEVALYAHNLYLDSGVVTEDSDFDAAAKFLVTNSVLHHTQWDNSFSHYYWTMLPYSMAQFPSTFRFMTNKQDKSLVCWNDNEWLSMLLDDFTVGGYGTQFNAVKVTSQNQSGIITTDTGVGIFYLQTPVLNSDNTLVVDGFRRIAVGPANIRATTWDWNTTNAPLALGENANTKYKIELGYWDGTDDTGFITYRTRTYILDCNCCAVRKAFYFINQYGAVDVMYFNEPEMPIQTSATKSTSFEKNLPKPHVISATGNERLNISNAIGIKLSKYVEENEGGLVNDFFTSPKIWAWDAVANDYVPYKMKDGTLTGNQADNGNLFECELEVANDGFKQRI